MSQSSSLAKEIITRLGARGVELWVEAGALRFRAPRNALDDAVRREIAKNRDAIINVLRQLGKVAAPAGDDRVRSQQAGQKPQLSFAQKRFWYLDQLDPGSPRYNIGSLLRVRERIDLRVLAKAVDDLFTRHEAFRSQICTSDGEPILNILSRPLISLDVLDLSQAPPTDIDEAIKAQSRDALRTSFDLVQGRLALMRVVRFAPDDHLILFVAHHIVADGWSLYIAWRDMWEFYEARVTSRPPRLTPLPLQQSDFAVWEQRKAQTGGFVQDITFWRENLATAPPLLELPLDRLRRLTHIGHGRRYNAVMSAAVVDELRKVARDQGATLFMALVAVWQVLLSRLSGQDDIVIGTPVATREDEGLKDVVGCLINNIALRGDLSGAPSFVNLLERTKRMTLDAFRHGKAPFDMVVEALNPPRSLSHAPIFQTLFTLMNFTSGNQIAPNGITSVPIETGTGAARFDLSLELSFMSNGAREGGMLAAYEFDSDIFDEETISELHDQYLCLLNSACENRFASLHNTPLIFRDKRRPLGAIDGSAAMDIAPLPKGSVASLTTLISQEGEHTADMDNQIAELLSRLSMLDVQVKLDGEKLSVSAPKGVLVELMRNELAARKSDIVAYLKAAERDASPSSKFIAVAPRDQDFALSHSQQRLWFIRQLDPDSSAYSIPGAVRMKGTIDTQLIQQTINDLVLRHESLRMRFASVEGSPRCRVERDASVNLDQVDLTSIPEDAREAAAIEMALHLSRRPFDLSRAPLIRAAVIRLKANEHVLVIVFDHMVTDGLSLKIILEEFREIYVSRKLGRPSNLPQLTIQFIDYIEWERKSLENGVLRKQVDYWKKLLKGAPAILDLPTDFPRPRLQTSNGARAITKISATLFLELKTMALREDVTLFMLLMAAFQLLLHRYTGQTDVVVGTAVANRARSDIERVVGFFANNIALRGDLSGNPTVAELLRRVRNAALQAYEYQQTPFEAIVDSVVSRRDLDHSPIFQVMLVLQGHASKKFYTDGVECEAMELPLSSARLDIAVDVFELHDSLEVVFEYNTDLFRASTIDRMQRSFCTLLAEMVGKPDLSIDKLGLLPLDEIKQVINNINNTKQDFPVEGTIHELFEKQVVRTPSKTAVVFDKIELSYSELNEEANRLANRLQELGVGRESLVGICLSRSASMVVAVLGVLKAGGAYVPLDPAFPAERLRFMLADANVEVIITEGSTASSIGETSCRQVMIDRDTTDLERLSGADRPSLSTSRNLAYVIYTSGSTGTPKGVMIEHRSVLNFLASMLHEPGISASDRLVAVTTLSFDIAGLELFGPLLAGATVVIAPRETTLDATRLAGLLETSNATILQATPATWRLLIEGGWPGRAGLKMLCGGEALPPDLATKLLGLGQELWNMYGPTETTIWSTICKVIEVTPKVSIGRPIANTQVYVLEPSGDPAPIGVLGELCIGGEGLARGYLNRPELTGERFVSMASRFFSNARLYRTGDLARFRSDGSLEFIGRRDNQVKLRGFRIELGEIEAMLAKIKGIKENVVQIREDEPGDQRLVAYVVVTKDFVFDKDAVRSALRASLPEYMVPGGFIVLETLPLTPNGKIDRNSLPAPVVQVPDDRTSDVVLNPVQQRVMEVWRSILKVDRIGLHDNFFDLGGHSMLLMKLQAGLLREFGKPVELIELFRQTTVQSQAAGLERAPLLSSGDGLTRARARAEKQSQLRG
jgi:amino acid adenylation domain-containing protein